MNLTFLDLDNNQISNISVLSGLTSLTFLSLDNNQISFAADVFAVDPGKEDYPVIVVTWYGALAQAVRWHLENRVLVYNNKTVVFD